MFVRRVRAVAVNPEPIKHRHIERRRKVAVRGPANRAFTQLKTQRSGNLSRLMKQPDHARRALEWPAINAAFDRERDALIERLEALHQILDAARFIVRAEARV